MEQAGKFIFAVCDPRLAIEALPTASQLLKGWKIYSGIMPTRRPHLVELWEHLCPNTPPPTNIEEMKKKLRPLLPPENKNIGDVQIRQIQGDAKNVGFILPKSPKKNRSYLPPVGIGLMQADLVF